MHHAGTPFDIERDHPFDIDLTCDVGPDTDLNLTHGSDHLDSKPAGFCDPAHDRPFDRGPDPDRTRPRSTGARWTTKCIT